MGQPRIERVIADRLYQGYGAEVEMGTRAVWFIDGAHVSPERSGSIIVTIHGKPSFVVAVDRETQVRWESLLGMAYNAGEARTLADLINRVVKDLSSRALAPSQPPLLAYNAPHSGTDGDTHHDSND